MSEVLARLKSSDDPLEQDLADVWIHWQDQRRLKDEAARLGYEPRDFNKMGAEDLIASRVKMHASGFEEVNPEMSYEALVVRYPDRFDKNIQSIAKGRLELGGKRVDAFNKQVIKFLVKSPLDDLFENGKVIQLGSPKTWVGASITLPEFKKEFRNFDDYLLKGVRAFLWLDEAPTKPKTKGNGLSAVITISDFDIESRQAVILEIEPLPAMVDFNFMKANSLAPDFVKLVYENVHKRIWHLDEDMIDSLLAASHFKHMMMQNLDHNYHPDETSIDLDDLEDHIPSSTLQERVYRPRQAKFRAQLVNQRGCSCAITGTTNATVIEAAHIVPYRLGHKGRDLPINGLLMRRDIHALYDDFQISIRPETKSVVVSKSVEDNIYRELDGFQIKDDVSLKNLNWHFKQYVEKQG